MQMKQIVLSNIVFLKKLFLDKKGEKNMKLNELYKEAISSGHEVNWLGSVERDAPWRSVHPEYPDEFLETEGDREIYDYAYHNVYKILIVKF